MLQICFFFTTSANFCIFPMLWCHVWKIPKPGPCRGLKIKSTLRPYDSMKNILLGVLKLVKKSSISNQILKNVSLDVCEPNWTLSLGQHVRDPCPKPILSWLTVFVTRCALRSSWWGLKSVMRPGCRETFSSLNFPDIPSRSGFSDKSGTRYWVGTVCRDRKGPYWAVIVTGCADRSTVKLEM